MILVLVLTIYNSNSSLMPYALCLICHNGHNAICHTPYALRLTPLRLGINASLMTYASTHTCARLFLHRVDAEDSDSNLARTYAKRLREQAAAQTRPEAKKPKAA